MSTLKPSLTFRVGKPPHQSSMKVLMVLWLVLIGVGLALLWNYSSKPGLLAKAKPFWPIETQLHRNPQFSTLVLFVHPHCACSKASIGELSQIMTQVNGKLNSFVVFVTPKNPDASWRDTDLWSDAKAISGVQTVLDAGGGEADGFGAQTSGQALLYDSQGKLVFSGGITSARGHFGDNFGKNAIITFVNENRQERQSTPVFGCALKDYRDAN